MSSWLITGASSGLGLAIGRVVLQKGATAVLTSRNVAKAKEMAPDIEKNGGHWLELELSNSDLSHKVKDAVTRHKVDTLVNNAGYPAVGALEDHSHKDVVAQFQANVFGPISVIQAALPVFRSQKKGTIVNVGSGASFQGMPGNTMYGASKAAMRTISEGLAPELAPFGIRVLLFEPGQFRTNLIGGMKTPVPGGVSEAYRGTPAEGTLQFFNSTHSSQPGDPTKGAERIYEVVTKTGLGAAESIKGRTRFVIGSDARGILTHVGQAWKDTAEEEASAKIANSTDL